MYYDKCDTGLTYIAILSSVFIIVPQMDCNDALL